jgi:3-hydroxybutyryl-CoA dehydrogenase
MKVTIVSDSKNTISEFQEKLEVSFNTVNKDTILNNKLNEDVDVFFLPDLDVENDLILEISKRFPKTPIVVNSVARVIETFPISAHIIGMNLLPTFINRPLAEVTGNSAEGFKALEALDWEIRKVESRVGMVTPRVIFMIINEAYYTLQEGTATKEDIDIGMKLGTNYPNGPFEWSKKIGLLNVFKTLEAIYEDTKEGRYKICPLLKRECF